ncbi:MAG: alpha/beta hydrolase [Hyphomicrobiales bacterium]|nr:alpha/beta hydrolase [Hyphomicrobiales bacterium]
MAYRRRQIQLAGRQMIFNGPETASATILLAHGAGAPMDSQSMNAAVLALASVGFRVARFEFGYMAARRQGLRKPPPRAETLQPEYFAAIDALAAAGPLIIGGKSMGGRVASMIADEAHSLGRIAGLLCLGYPFHPPGKPTQLRTRHLADLQTPTLIFQGTRDEFGTREEVSGYALSPGIKVVWLEDGDHDLKPRKSISGLSVADHLGTMARRTLEWSGSLAR